MKEKHNFKIKKVGKIRKSERGEKKKGSFSFLKPYRNHFKYAGIAIVTIALTTLVFFSEQTGQWFKASVLEAPQPFNGTVFPVSKVPDWTHWKGDNSKTHYSEISPTDLIDLPNYDLSKMTFPDDKLVWGNASQDIIRNTKITYPVVYLGNYEMDHQEGEGSHLAVDIKMPIGTPVHSIANGKVVTVSMTESGFGHHVVIQHIGVPDPENPGHTTTLYSCFNHMDEIQVSEGQNVLKGQLIGTSGNTGTATTPHLHFQIDRDSAPWHPYWPFSSSESNAAGLGFFEAVNAGLGMSNAKNNTVNPMAFVTQYVGSYSLASSDNTAVGNSNSNDEIVNNDPGIEIVENPFDDETTPIHTDTPDRLDTSLFHFELMGEETSLVRNGVTITAIDPDNQIAKMSDTDELRVELSGVGRLVQKVYKKSDFKNSAIKISVNSDDVGITNVVVGKSSHQVSFIDQVQGIASFRIDTDGYFQENRPEIVKLVAVDANGAKTPAVNFSGDVEITVKDGRASVSPETLSARDFQNGEAEIQVTVPNKEYVILRAQQGALIGESEAIYAEETGLFSDVGVNSPHYEAIKSLYDAGVVNGYSDGSFKPNNTVNRAEALKMLMLAFNVSNGPTQPLSFWDTDSGAWYATTLGTAVERGIVRGYDDGSFKPGQTVNKAEYLKMLYETNDIEMSDPIVADPYSDVPKDAWFAPYAYLTNRRNILDAGRNLYPSNGMTRGEVAETIYRLKYVLDHNLVSYSK